MKRIITGILILPILLSCLAGCTSKGDLKASSPAESSGVKPLPQVSAPKAKDSAPAQVSASKPGNSTSKPAREVEGTEISTFMGNYMETKSKIWDAMGKKFEQEQNTAFALGSLGYVFIDLLIVEVGLFDTLTVKNGDTYKGTLMLTGIDAWKKVNGDIMEFGYDYTHPKDKNEIKKGDREVAKGKFDKKAGALAYDHYTERGGVKTSRYVVEINKNSDSSYSSQLYSIKEKQGGNKDTELDGFFTWFEGNNIMSVMAEKRKADLTFTYNSIFGKKNLKPEEMAKGMDILSKVSFVDGKAAYEEVKK